MVQVQFIILMAHLQAMVEHFQTQAMQEVRLLLLVKQEVRFQITVTTSITMQTH